MISFKSRSVPDMLGSNFKVSEDLTKIIKIKITETVLLSTQNIYFDLEIRELL